MGIEKAAASVLFKRAGVWCKPAKKLSFPLLSLPALPELGTLYRAMSGRFCGNLGGNAESFRPISGLEGIFYAERKQNSNLGGKYAGFKVSPGKPGNRQAEHPQ